MEIDDEIQQRLRELAESSEVLPQLVLRNAMVVASVAFAASEPQSVLQSMGILGTAILAAVGDVGKGRFRERLFELLTALKERMEEIDEQKIDRDYISSEEFQTVLLDAFDQLRTSHDRNKIRLLAGALASCSNVDFSTEHRKELFVRLVRDLTPFHVLQLKELAIAPAQLPKEFSPELRWAYRPTVKAPKQESLMVLQQLAAEGLVEEELASHALPSVPLINSQSDAIRFVESLVKAIARPPLRCFRLSEFGRDFINFIRLLGESESR